MSSTTTEVPKIPKDDEIKSVIPDIGVLNV